MKPSLLAKAVDFSINTRLPLLIKGAPGIGKSDIVAQACQKKNVKLIISHPVVSDPTDYKGLPFPDSTREAATFLPFGELKLLLDADTPTVFFLDDLGQAPASVQAACMQLILARRINGHKVSDKVIFLAATNRREDKAGVMGILEPVKSRFCAILELVTDIEDWIAWAIKNDMPHELTAFIRFKPKLLHDFKASADIVNTPCPRTVAYIGKMMKEGISDDIRYEMFSGAAGEGFAAEFITFLNIYKQLPSVDEIIANPDKVKIPEEPSLLFAVCGALANKCNKNNIENIFKYGERMSTEFQMLLVKDSFQRNKSIHSTSVFEKWASKHINVILE